MLHAVIWTRVSGTPQKMGNLVLDQEEISFTYTEAYIQSGLPGFSLLGDPQFWEGVSVTYPVSERIRFFPRLISLLPGNGPRNLQRKHYLSILRHLLGKEPPESIETEWRLLSMAGHGGIGHVDVFEDDQAALDYYGRKRSDIVYTGKQRSQIWMSLKRDVLDEGEVTHSEVIDELIGPTPSVNGMISKLLVSIDDDKKNLVIHPSDSEGKRNVVLKIEPPEYRGVLDLEALCLDLHRDPALGFEVPWFYRYDDPDSALKFLAIERFDVEDDRPVPLESLLSIIATGNTAIRESGDIMLEDIPGIMDTLSEYVILDSGINLELYRRFLMALLTGNGDLHLENLSLLGGVSDCKLSPVYDPAPMRAWPRHNLVSAISFDREEYHSNGEFFIAFGKRFDLTKKEIRESINAVVTATHEYPIQLRKLIAVPPAQVDRLLAIYKQEKSGLLTALKKL